MSKSDLKRIYFYNDYASIVDKSVKEYCCISDRFGILKVKDMIGFFIFGKEVDVYGLKHLFPFWVLRQIVLVEKDIAENLVLVERFN
ncbi:hypothetical protein ABE867_15845 [Enterococcus gallinarum]|mgnify:CR=1 FL=1|uniref:hypothetical protein n=1 Tax=Enterococcus gallinarum TaxID=1353 RepID=UPI003D6B4E85